MIQSFADAATADVWEQRNSTAARRVPPQHLADRVSEVDDARRGAASELVGRSWQSSGGADRGPERQHSIRVNKQYRITFRWEGHDAHDVCCEDYP
jgi:plasmid maintenance system killer protein